MSKEKDLLGRNKTGKARQNGFRLESRAGDKNTTGVSLKGTKEYDELKRYYEKLYSKG